MFLALWNILQYSLHGMRFTVDRMSEVLSQKSYTESALWNLKHPPFLKKKSPH
jgi:hypothetical protein